MSLVDCEVGEVSLCPTPGSGRLLALARCEITIADVALTIYGIRIVREAASVHVQMPRHRDANGRWEPALALPHGLAVALFDAVMGAYLGRDDVPECELRPD